MNQSSSLERQETTGYRKSKFLHLSDLEVCKTKNNPHSSSKLSPAQGNEVMIMRNQRMNKFCWEAFDDHH